MDKKDLYIKENLPYWHNRSYLPHYENSSLLQMITYRLGDSLPQKVLTRLKDEPETIEGDEKYRKRIEICLDSGYGSCVLKTDEVAFIVYNTWLFYNGERYKIHAWVIMPNHIHILFQPLLPFTLSRIVEDWKKFSSREINRLINKKGHLWNLEYWDRYIRNEAHYKSAVEYIHNNPVKAGLVSVPEEWKWSSYKEYKKNLEENPDIFKGVIIE